MSHPISPREYQRLSIAFARDTLEWALHPAVRYRDFANARAEWDEDQLDMFKHGIRSSIELNRMKRELDEKGQNEWAQTMFWRVFRLPEE